MTTTLRTILANKPEIYSVPPETTVFDALRLMAQKNVGALVILQAGKVGGIFSERDYARKVVLAGKSSKDTPVSEIMTSKVICVEPDRTARECMAIMTEMRIRHLPVVEHDRVVGVISIGDVVRAVLAELHFTIEQLERYISH